MKKINFNKPICYYNDTNKREVFHIRSGWFGKYRHQILYVSNDRGVFIGWVDSYGYIFKENRFIRNCK